MTEYAGISRNMAEYHGISRHFPGINRNITIFFDGSHATVYKHGRLTTYCITKVMDLSIHILTVSNKQKLYTGSFICCLYHYYQCSPKILNQYDFKILPELQRLEK
jgi:hypothetical protein